MSTAGDIMSERGTLFLGSRLKRLADRLQGDVVRIVERAGVPVQPSHYAPLATLERFGPLTVTELAQALQISQPAVTRTLARLLELKLVETLRLHRDQRHKTVSLTAEGRGVLLRSKLLVWPQVEAAVAEVLHTLPGSLLEHIDALESQLANRPLNERARCVPAPPLSLCEYTDDLADVFRAISVEWIETLYRIEPADLEVLDHPRERIIEPGGAILFVQAQGVGIIGTCALRKSAEREFELTKMGVLRGARGVKAGEFLLRAAITRAHALGAELLYLLSNRKSAAAIRLYEKLGFVHDADILRRFGAHYQRCDVAMRYQPQAS